jgi:hypothetical protein
MNIITFAAIAASFSLGATPPSHPSLALAVVAPDPGEYGFGARHTASEMGIPYFYTHDLGEALRQPMVLMTGAVDGNYMTDAVTTQVKSYIESGGTLVVDDGESGGIEALAGISGLTPSQHRYTLTFDTSTGDPGLGRLKFAEERTISLGNKAEGQAVLTQGYTLAKGTDAQVIGKFDDGTAALVMRRIGKGRIYVTGLAYYDAVLRAQDDQALDAGRDYDNGFEPSADVPQMIVRDWYLHYVPGAVVTDMTPDGLAGALIITHDVDYVKSVTNMLAYAAAEKAHGFSSTFFIQAKTVRDTEDTNFFDANAKRIVAKIKSEGSDIASHTVSHSPNWKEFAVGTGLENPDNYHPFVKEIAPDHSHGITLGATLTGEVHVSQERLDSCAPGIDVDALRTGYLLINPKQWTVLERYGYRIDSSYGAGEILTSIPYTAMEEQGGSRESSVLEFPIVIADADNWVPMYPHMAAFDAVLDKESDIHGVVTTLIHDDVVADKLPTELALVAHARPKMWVGNIDAFGDFWDDRAETSVVGTSAGGDETITVTAPHGVDGLTLDFPAAVQVISTNGTTATPVAGGSSVVLGHIPPAQAVTVTVRPSGR